MRMLSYGILYIGLTAVVIALIYMFSDAEQSRYNELSQKVSNCSATNVKLMAHLSGLRVDMDMLKAGYETEIGKIQQAVLQVAKRSDEACHGAEAAQEHCVRLRNGQIKLQEKLSLKKPTIKIPSPIQIEIMGPTKKAKTK